MNILIGLFILIGGAVIIYFSSHIAQLGRVERAEKNLGSTRGMYALIGFVITILGFMILFGFVDFKSNDNNRFGDTTIITQ